MDEKELIKARIRFYEWQQYAQEDEQMASLALKEKGPPNQICFHSQQMAEKYLKGFLVYHKKLPQKIHNLNVLITDCMELDPSFEELKEHTSRLNEYYIEGRYPGDIHQFSLEEGKKALESAIRVKEFVLGKIQ